MIILKNSEYDEMVETMHNLKRYNARIAPILEENGKTYRSLSKQILEVQKENEAFKKELEAKETAMRMFDQHRKKVVKQRDTLKQMVDIYQGDFEYLKNHNLCSLCSEPDKDSCGVTCNFMYKHEEQLKALAESLE